MPANDSCTPQMIQLIHDPIDAGTFSASLRTISVIMAEHIQDEWPIWVSVALDTVLSDHAASWSWRQS